MDDVKAVNDLAKEGEAAFFHLWITKDGGLSFELNLQNQPDKHSALGRVVGNCTIALWQIAEWATAMIRMDAQARAQRSEQLRQMLERLPEDGVLN